MNEYVFKGNSVEDCIEKATKKLNVHKRDLKYTVLKEKKGLFSKSASISVENIIKENNDNDGTISVKNGKIIITNPKENGKNAKLSSNKEVILLVDGEEVRNIIPVTEKSNIEVQFVETEASREMKITVTPDKMKCFLDIKYKNKIIYALKDEEKSNTVVLKSYVKEEIPPPFFTKDDIMKELKNYNVVYGLIEENLKLINDKKNIQNLLIAQGDEVVDDEEDILEVLFDNENNEFKEDKKGRVDFKSIGFIDPIKQGDVVAELHAGKTGKDGKEVTGKIKKRKIGKKINLNAGNGCEVKDNKIISTTDGKPCIKSNMFCVFQVHEINSDVDLKTGNIEFIGDVLVRGTVKEGMKVDAGNSVDIEKNVERSEVLGKGDINIKGNIISSTVHAGGEDVFNLNLIKNLSELKKSLSNLIQTVMEIKKFNLLGKDISDGETIKVLIEKKFKYVNKLSLNIIKLNILKGDRDAEISLLLKQKLIGSAPLNIKHFGELDGIIEKIDKELEILNSELSLPVNVNISYCQDSKINSSGDIIINGRGEYVSTIDAHRAIYFNGENSVARGGVIKASSEIKCKTVGSTAGVTTKLVVDNDGHIWIDIAYQNTILVLGGREHILTEACKNVHAYIDDDGEITVEKLKI